MVSTIIAVLDEEVHIQRVLDSVVGLGPVFVIDGGSRDRTPELARAAGATVVENRWSGYSAQKNWALAHLEISTEWVLFLDADEVVTPELGAEIERAVSADGVDGYYIPRQNVFLGRVLLHAWWYPDYQLRLFRSSRGRFESRLVHEHVFVEGRKGFLQHPLVHENLKGIDAFVERHLRYAGLEAIELRRARLKLAAGEREGRLLGSWPERRRALKTRVWYRLHGRPLIRFLWLYLVKRGFLDGRQGLVYSQLLAFYEALIDAKLLEAELEGPPQAGVSGDD